MTSLSVHFHSVLKKKKRRKKTNLLGNSLQIHEWTVSIYVYNMTATHSFVSTPMSIMITHAKFRNSELDSTIDDWRKPSHIMIITSWHCDTRSSTDCKNLGNVHYLLFYLFLFFIYSCKQIFLLRGAFCPIVLLVSDVGILTSLMWSSWLGYPRHYFDFLKDVHIFQF